MFTVRGLMLRISLMSRLDFPRRDPDQHLALPRRQVQRRFQQQRLAPFGRFAQAQINLLRPGPAQIGDVQLAAAMLHPRGRRAQFCPGAECADGVDQRAVEARSGRDGGPEDGGQQFGRLGRAPQQPAVRVRGDLSDRPPRPSAVRALCDRRAVARCTRMRAISSSMTMGLVT
ncbi:MAG: hypothetical protein WDN45_15750 [Caulobacteraceae bacterium]